MKEYSMNSNKVLNNPIEIKYKNWKGKVGNRIITPIKLRYGESEFHKGNQWILKAWDVSKSAVREFAINDILEYIPHEEDWYKYEPDKEDK